MTEGKILSHESHLIQWIYYRPPIIDILQHASFLGQHLLVPVLLGDLVECAEYKGEDGVTVFLYQT